MKNAYDVLRQKELQLSRLVTEVEALRAAAPLLSDDQVSDDQEVGNDNEPTSVAHELVTVVVAKTSSAYARPVIWWEQDRTRIQTFTETNASKPPETKLMSGVHHLRRISFRNHCPYCLSSRVYGSRGRKWWEKILFIFLLRLVRCHNCMRHHYRPIILSAAKNPMRETVSRKQPRTVSSGQKKDRSA